MQRVGINVILWATTEWTGVTAAELIGRSRTRRIADARHIAMTTARALTDLSYSQIGDALDRDHATVIHAVRRVEADPELAALTDTVTRIALRRANRPCRK